MIVYSLNGLIDYLFTKPKNYEPLPDENIHFVDQWKRLLLIVCH